MDQLLQLLSVYYECTALAEAHQLTQIERFACNETYQQAKRLFLEGALARPGSILTKEQNTEAYLLFKAWEVENAALVAALRSH
ncbi:hypothetical protein QTO30_03000 [Yoonia sp. GPGPB17]|uniref:hypothetical protein n=1 Tax=Yoonia sp. GPGPB17 TaxID=3026147 RepID=UPI0030BF7134